MSIIIVVCFLAWSYMYRAMVARCKTISSCLGNQSNSSVILFCLLATYVLLGFLALPGEQAVSFLVVLEIRILLAILSSFLLRLLSSLLLFLFSPSSPLLFPPSSPPLLPPSLPFSPLPTAQTLSLVGMFVNIMLELI